MSLALKEKNQGGDEDNALPSLCSLLTAQAPPALLSETNADH